MSDFNDNNDRMLPTERQRLIIEGSRRNGVLRIKDLAVEFQVSEMTIRRDLDVLEADGLIVRKFGGAIATQQAAQEVNHKTRLETSQHQKMCIATLAEQFVHQGDAIAIDASTTGLALAKRLSSRKGITIVTNSLDIIHELRFNRVDVIFIGGYLRPMRDSLVGPLSMQMLDNLRVDKAFFSSHGVLLSDGFLDPDFEEIEIKRRIIANATISIALVDSSKFGKRAMGLITRLNQVDRLITDSDVDPVVAEQLFEMGLDVRIAPLTD